MASLMRRKSSGSVILIFAQRLKIVVNSPARLFDIPIILWAWSNLVFASAVWRMVTLFAMLRNAIFKVLLQTIRMGVKAAVIGALPSYAFVRKMYCSIKSFLPTFI